MAAHLEEIQAVGGATCFATLLVGLGRTAGRLRKTAHAARLAAPEFSDSRLCKRSAHSYAGLWPEAADRSRHYLQETASVLQGIVHS